MPGASNFHGRNFWIEGKTYHTHFFSPAPALFQLQDSPCHSWCSAFWAIVCPSHIVLFFTFSDFSCHSQLREDDPPVFQTQIMCSNYCIYDVPDHVFQSPLDWKCILVYWKETETYISFTSWLCPWVIRFYIFARKFSIKSPTCFSPTNWWKELTRGPLRDEPRRQGSTFGGPASLRTSLWLLLCASSLAGYHPSKDRQRCCTPWKHLTEQDVGTKVPHCNPL